MIHHHKCSRPILPSNEQSTHAWLMGEWICVFARTTVFELLRPDNTSHSPLTEARGRAAVRANTHIPVTTHILVTAHTRFTSFEVRGSVTFVSVCAESPPGPSRAIAGDSARPPGRAQPAGKAQPGRAVSDDVTLRGAGRHLSS